MLEIEVLGAGCARCRELESNAREAVLLSGAEARVVKVTALDEIVDRGVFVTPALAVDGEILVAGRVPTVAEIVPLLCRRAGASPPAAAAGG